MPGFGAAHQRVSTAWLSRHYAYRRVPQSRGGLGKPLRNSVKGVATRRRDDYGTRRPAKLLDYLVSQRFVPLGTIGVRPAGNEGVHARGRAPTSVHKFCHGGSDLVEGDENGLAAVRGDHLKGVGGGLWMAENDGGQPGRTGVGGGRGAVVTRGGGHHAAAVP